MTETKSVNALLFSMQYGGNIVKDKLLLSGHNPYYKGGERIDELHEDLKNFPDVQVIIMEAGAAHESSYDWVEVVKETAPHLPIILCAYEDTFKFWVNFCRENKKPHQIISFENDNFDKELSAAISVPTN